MNVEKLMPLTRDQLVELFVAATVDELRGWYVLLAAAARDGRVTADEVAVIVSAGEAAATAVGSKAERLRRRRLANIFGVIDGSRR